MYYVRLKSGEQKSYRTVEEMVWDLELGVLTGDALIYHSQTKAWVPVARHPQLGSRLPADSPGEQEVALEFDLLSDDEIAALTPAPAPPASPPAAAAAEAPAPGEAAEPPPPARPKRDSLVVPLGAMDVAGDEAGAAVERPEGLMPTTAQQASSLEPLAPLVTESAAREAGADEGAEAKAGAPVEGLEIMRGPEMPPPAPDQPAVASPVADLVMPPSPPMPTPVSAPPPPLPAAGITPPVGLAAEPPAVPLPPANPVPGPPRTVPVTPSTPEPAAALDAEPAPVPADEEVIKTWSTDYQPLEWKPERRFTGVLIAGAALLVALVGVGGWFAWQWWKARPRPAEAAATTSPDETTAAALPADSVSDSAIAAAVRTLSPPLADSTPTPRPAGRPVVTPPPPTLEPARPARAPGSAVTPDILRPRSLGELRRSYVQSYADARAEMDSSLMIAGFTRLFSAARLGTPDSLRAGRRAVVAARNVIRSYHNHEVQIEAAFRDTIAYQVQKVGWTRLQQQDWNARTPLKESYEAGQLTDSLLGNVDGIYQLLLAEWGAFRLSGGTIGFDDPRVAAEYRRLTGWLAARLDRMDTGDDGSTPPTAQRVLRATGGARPPLLSTRSPGTQ